MAQCQIHDCTQPVIARGWCSTHYARWRRLGDPMPDQPIQRHGDPLIDRALRFVDKTDGCWLWTGARKAGGYGQIKVGEQSRLAHRALYELLVGPIPEGLELDHLCRVRECVNPEHLEPVTRRENVLRGVAPAAANARKTHCPQGHPYEGRNVYINAASGGRVCRTCNNAAALRYRQRKRAAS